MALLIPEFVLPFLFTFAVAYGALQLSTLFGKRVNVLIGAVLGLFAISNAWVIDTINEILPFAAIFFVVVFFIGFLVKAVSSGKQGEKPDFTLIVVLLVFVLLLLSAQGGEFIEKYVKLPGFGTENLFFLVGGIVLLLIVFLAYKASTGEGK
ncbi:MAG: hypothetical protein KKA90_00555 [Nanoarchaeota archaeon]|nr:hypothetical protein [Nanoarchaeota archaeon]